jgi:hypothetical protein
VKSLWRSQAADGTQLELVTLTPMPGIRQKQQFLLLCTLPGKWRRPACMLDEDSVVSEWYENDPELRARVTDLIGTELGPVLARMRA